jgi:hypothetical protein
MEDVEPGVRAVLLGSKDHLRLGWLGEGDRAVMTKVWVNAIESQCGLAADEDVGYPY